MYEAILFNLDDTLISLSGCEAAALQRTLRNSALADTLPADFTEVSAAYAKASATYWRQRAALDITREQVLEFAFREFLAQIVADIALADALAQQFWVEFCRSAVFNPGARETLRRLSESYRLGVITNGYIDSQRGRLEATEMTMMFEVILISEEVGIAKPDLCIFNLALSRLELPPEAVLYVGDSIAHDYQGARAAGIDFCHYCPNPLNDMGLQPVKFRISRLAELLDLLATGT